MTGTFEDLREDFLRITAEIVWCSVTTVDGKGRPRSRILHPIWEVVDGRPVGWVFTGRTPVKAAHLAANPHVSFAYWSPSQSVVLGECVATWSEEAEEKRHVWELFANTPPPVGYDLTAFGLDGPDNPGFTPLRLSPYRVQVLDGKDFPATLTPRAARIS